MTKMMKSSYSGEIISFLMFFCLAATKSLQKCVEPDTFPRMSFEQHINTTKAQSYSITPGWYEKMETADKVPSEYINITHSHYLGSQKCRKPKRKNSRNQDNTLNSLSQCMWRYVENNDTENRIPGTILEVKCVCSSPLYSKKKSGLVCQSVIEYISVLRKVGCSNGVFDYTLVWEPRAVACVATTLPEPKRLYPIAHKTPE
ncbi:uncharacterized protein LOC123533615 [Mercenaria mercenaria]|uniref:uncharacterized protein LOC123533615 n=1 Tax=Mercenaria mercenaria TaxID=6596 RepID=UPI00234E474D|nr:uncharacterized protein LOC123533615 [Mercenaria mercenaria]